MRYCIFCGAEIPPSAAYCQICGKAQPAGAATAAEEPKEVDEVTEAKEPAKPGAQKWFDKITASPKNMLIAGGCVFIVLLLVFTMILMLIL